MRARDHQHPDLDVSARLAFALRAVLEGEVRFDPGSRHLYATDASHYRQVPVGVVLPRTVRDVVETVRICREHGVPVTSRGGGTSLAGQAINVAVVLDLSRHLTAILGLDPERRRARVQPGVVLDDLRDTAEEHGLTFGPDPSTHNRCTLGGMIGNNACGMHSLTAGRTQDNVEALDVLLADGTRLELGWRDLDEVRMLAERDDRVGELHRGLLDLRDRYGELVRERYPSLRRRVSGYNLEELLHADGMHTARAFVGTEGTCGVVLEATVGLVDSPPHRRLVALGYPDIVAAAEGVPAVLDAAPLALEGMEERLTRHLAPTSEERTVLPRGGAYLLVQLGGETAATADGHARRLVERLGRCERPPTIRLYDDPEQERRVWQLRESGLGTTSLAADGRQAWPGWEDAAVPPALLAPYLRDFRELMRRHEIDGSIYGHFGEGCVHCRLTFDLTTGDGVATYRRFTREAAELVVGYGGSLSGEHGDGQSRADLLAVMYGEELVGAFEAFKQIFDPDELMNPGKLVRPYGRSTNLRLGGDEAPWEPEVHFTYPEDGHRFSEAMLRCVGIGTCRRDDGHGTMCPSYMVTHEEQHSTRGRARLLFEMLQPDSQLDGWRDTAVADALELCLSCKGCSTDCPADVDMATYKSEFMSHHWRGRVRPPSHYALGLVSSTVRLASRLPGSANLLLSVPGAARLLETVAGIARQRPAPKLSAETFRAWYEQRGSWARRDAEPVMLFPDTFTEHFEPTVGQAAVRVLEHAGYRVVLPPPVCCGRPLYDYGMLERAGRHLDTLIEVFGDHVRAGGRVVGLEPSCVAVFRDELLNLRHHDPDAHRLAEHTLTLAEFLVDVARYRPPSLRRRAVVQRHCHQEATAGFTAERTLWERMGLEASFLDGGCCGMAGGFGFTAGEPYRVSVAAGERKLAPTVRALEPETIPIADGFSCRTQLAHLDTGRRALHLAEVLDLARTAQLPERYPERAAPVPVPARVGRREAGMLATAAAGLVLLAARRRVRPGPEITAGGHRGT